MGLWLLQECLWVRASQGDARTYAELTEMAAGASPLCAVINVDDSDFQPGDMPERILGLLPTHRTGGSGPGEKRVGPLHPGGDRPQISAVAGAAGGDAGAAVGADPHRRRRRGESAAVAFYRGRDRDLRHLVEATAVGNILVQAVVLGHLSSSERGPRGARNSFEVVTFEPGQRARWDEAYGRLKELPA